MQHGPHQELFHAYSATQLMTIDQFQALFAGDFLVGTNTGVSDAKVGAGIRGNDCSEIRAGVIELRIVRGASRAHEIGDATSPIRAVTT